MSSSFLHYKKDSEKKQGYFYYDFITFCNLNNLLRLQNLLALPAANFYNRYNVIFSLHPMGDGKGRRHSRLQMMDPNKTELRKAFIINFLYFLLLAGAVFFILKNFLPMFAPFLIGFMVASLLTPLIRRICSRWKIRRSLAAIGCLLLCYTLIFTIIWFFGSRFVSMIQEQATRLPEYYNRFLVPELVRLSDKLLASFPDSRQTMEELLYSLENSMQQGIMSLSGMIISLGASWIVGFPAFLIQLIFTIISSFFFTLDYDTVINFVLRQFKPERRAMLVEIVTSARTVIWKILRVYALLMTITFFELYAGFTLLKIPMAPLLALLVAIVDILPVLGTGTILIPWGILLLILGNTPLGIGILILYVVITAVRQFLEPKIIGSQVGLHPIVTLLCIFAGAQLIGVIGIFAFPVIATIIKKMNDEGTIHVIR